MSTTTLTMSTPTPLSVSKPDKAIKKQSKIIKLSLPSSVLKRFESKSPAASFSTEDMPQIKTIPQESTSAPSTPLPVDAPSPSSATDKKEPSVNGLKRSTPGPDSKPKARPGPKKKPRLEDGTIDHSTTKPVTTTNNVNANPRLGPKANTGFINANLRALDRTGTPCRKWQRNGFQVRSFTGVSWELPSWKGSATSALTNGSDSSTKDVSITASDNKPSETSTEDRVDKMEISYATSSPPPMPMPKINGFPAQ